MEHLDLHVLRQRGGKALDIQLLRIEPHGLDKDLMPVLVCEADHLILNGGAIAGSYTMDDAGKEGGAVEIGPDHVMGLFIRIGQVADRLILRRLFRLEGEGNPVLVSPLDLHFGEVHAPPVDSGRRARLEAADGKAQLQQTVGQRQRSLQTVGAADLIHLAHDGPAAQEGAGGHDGRPHFIDGAAPGPDTGDPVLFGKNISDLRLTEGEILLKLQRMLHDLLIFSPVGLRPQGPDRRALAPVKQPILDTGLVRRAGHLSTQCVQLPDQMSLAGSADGRIAGHIAHCIQIDGKADRPKPHAGGGQRRLDTGMAGANDGNIKSSCQIVHWAIPPVGKSKNSLKVILTRSKTLGNSVDPIRTNQYTFLRISPPGKEALPYETDPLSPSGPLSGTGLLRLRPALPGGASAHAQPAGLRQRGPLHRQL